MSWLADDQIGGSAWLRLLRLVRLNRAEQILWSGCPACQQGWDFQMVTRMKPTGGVQTIQALDVFNGSIKAKRDPRKRVAIDYDVLRIGRLRQAWVAA